MTIITLAFCTNNNKILKELYNLYIYSDEFANTIIKQNKKCYKFIKIILNNNHIDYLLEYYNLMDFSNASQYHYISNIDSGFSALTLYLIIWNIAKSNQWILNDYDRPTRNKLYKHIKTSPDYFKNNYNVGNNYKIYTKHEHQEGSINLYYNGEDNRHDHGNAIYYLIDEHINLFMLLNNLLFYFEGIRYKKYPYYCNISKKIEVDVKYYNIENYKYMNMINTCLPINNIMKKLLFGKQLKLHKNTRMKIMKTIHVLRSYGMHENIIHKYI